VILIGAAAAAPRAAEPAGREVGPEGLSLPADDGGAIAASVYSLPSAFFDAGDALPFLAGVRAADPRRALVVLADPAQIRSLAPRAARLAIQWIATGERRYSPWPRDPFSLARDRSGRVVALLRPNLQPGREEDVTMGIDLVRGLPEALDAAWGGARWARARIPFHNGQVLSAGGFAWMSLHTLEPRILALLGLDRVPVASFATPAGVDRYLAAAHRAAAELAALYGRPPRFVHPLPERGTAAERAAAMARIGGGAGYDLDSLVTFLPPASGKLGRERALVADVAAGRALLARLGGADWSALAAAYDLVPEGLPAAMAAAQRAPRPEALAGYLDLVAGELARSGVAVARLPLLFVPTALLRDREGVSHADFLLTWNNVVVERRDGALRAEGFASRLPAGDAKALQAFAEEGAHLDLLPPLVHSVVLNGGYRCASNHLRAR